MIMMIDSTEEGRLHGPRIEWRARAKRSPPQNPTNVLSRKILEIWTFWKISPLHIKEATRSKIFELKIKEWTACTPR